MCSGVSRKKEGIPGVIAGALRSFSSCCISDGRCMLDPSECSSKVKTPVSLELVPLGVGATAKGSVVARRWHCRGAAK